MDEEVDASEEKGKGDDYTEAGTDDRGFVECSVESEVS